MCEVVVLAEDWFSWVFEDKKRCRMVSDERCIMCDSGVGEDVIHFLPGCGEFERDQQVRWIMCAKLWEQSVIQ